MALAGIETLHPDVFVIEERGIPRVIGVGVNTGGFVGVAEKGSTDRADLITNLTQFSERLGKFFNGSYLEPSVRAFFDQGGTRCFVVRVVGLGALVASGTLVNHEGSPALDVDAISPGAWGNNITLTTEVWRTTLSAASVTTGSVLIPVFSLRNIKRGDLITITDPASATTIQAFVYNILVATRELVVRPLQGLGAFVFPIGSLVQSASDHRLNTVLAAPLTDGEDKATLRTAVNLSIGARLYFDDGNNFGSAVVTGIDGSIVRFAPILISGAATLAATTTIAVSQEFVLRVFEKGKLRDGPFEGLSMEPTNERDYFGTRLRGEANEAKIVSVIDLFPAVADLTRALPAPVVSAPLAGGTEGAPVTDADFIGSDVAPLTGMNLLGTQPELNFFSIPGITTVEVERAAADFADRSGRLIAVLDAPLADDEPQEILDFRNIEANFDTSYAALYYPWVITRDPNVGVSGGGRFIMPPSGHVQGKYAEVGVQRGIHVAPANIVLRGVLDLTHNTTDGEWDLLNPAGVNVIRSFPGEGIRIMGARTLTSFKDGRHYVPVRRMLNFVKESLRRGLRFALFEPNEPNTWANVRDTVQEFLRSLFDRGQLFSPDGTFERAAFVKCDEETNPTSEIREGRLNVEVGVNPLLPAEFIVVRLGLFDGGSTIEEEVARR